MQTIIVFIILAVVLVAIAWRLYKALTKKSSESPLCGDCDADCEIRDIIEKKNKGKEEK